MGGRDAPASPLHRTGETAAPPCGLGSDSEYDYEAATRCSDECEAHSGSNSADDVSCAESEACEGEEEEEEDEGAYAVGALSARARAAFSVLDEGGLRERLTDSVSSVVSVLSCSPDEALLLLRTYKFNSARVSEEWFQARLGASGRAVQETVLVLTRRASPSQDEAVCRKTAGLPPVLSPNSTLATTSGDSVRLTLSAGPFHLLPCGLCALVPLLSRFTPPHRRRSSPAACASTLCR